MSAPTPGHFIRVYFDGDGCSYEFICEAGPDAPCRTIVIDEDSYGEPFPVPVTKHVDYCNAKEWFDNDGAGLGELAGDGGNAVLDGGRVYPQPQRFDLVRFPVDYTIGYEGEQLGWVKSGPVELVEDDRRVAEALRLYREGPSEFHKAFQTALGMFIALTGSVPTEGKPLDTVIDEYMAATDKLRREIESAEHGND